MSEWDELSASNGVEGSPIMEGWFEQALKKGEK